MGALPTRPQMTLPLARSPPRRLSPAVRALPSEWLDRLEAPGEEKVRVRRRAQQSRRRAAHSSPWRQPRASSAVRKSRSCPWPLGAGSPPGQALTMPSAGGGEGRGTSVRDWGAAVIWAWSAVKAQAGASAASGRCGSGSQRVQSSACVTRGIPASREPRPFHRWGGPGVSRWSALRLSWAVVRIDSGISFSGQRPPGP